MGQGSRLLAFRIGWRFNGRFHGFTCMYKLAWACCFSTLSFMDHCLHSLCQGMCHSCKNTILFSVSSLLHHVTKLSCFFCASFCAFPYKSLELPWPSRVLSAVSLHSQVQCSYKFDLPPHHQLIASGIWQSSFKWQNSSHNRWQIRSPIGSRGSSFAAYIIQWLDLVLQKYFLLEVYRLSMP